MAAPAYIEQLMAWVQANIDNEQVLPSKIGTFETQIDEQRCSECC
jgi:hypothetical protein